MRCRFSGFFHSDRTKDYKPFFEKGNFLLISRGYIEVIQCLEIFPTSARTAHNLQESNDYRS